MNIYRKKQVWKIGLVITAFIIVISSLFYTNNLVRKVSIEEQKKAKLWAEAIQKKSSLIQYTQELFVKLGEEETKKVKLWANATQQLASSALGTQDLSFVFEVIKNNQTVPVILTDSKNNIISYLNFDSALIQNPDYIKQELEKLKQGHPPIIISISSRNKNFIYYKDSRLFTDLKENMNDLIKSFITEIVANSASVPVLLTDSDSEKIIGLGNIDTNLVNTKSGLKQRINYMKLQNQPIPITINNTKFWLYYEESQLLKQLRYYPYIQFGIIGLFLIIAYYLFSTSRRSEQNYVWVGMSKETAHQLGTPLSSLMAWNELLKQQHIDQTITTEIDKDLHRLNTITERFSKIGSDPILQPTDIIAVIKNTLDYLQTRLSKKTIVKFNSNVEEAQVSLNVSLFEWVIENIVKNAVDSMNGVGSITIDVNLFETTITIDITDTGKGIEKTKFKTVFEPGFTTKKRGWGLGLSLAKRIIEDYHKGKIIVKDSVVNQGTTFRITLDA